MSSHTNNPQFQNTIREPIFILGSGRSGTTILYKLLGAHPEVCWFSNITNAYPNIPQLSVLQRVFDVPYLGQLAKRIMFTKKGRMIPIMPSEGENIYRTLGRFENKKKSTKKDYPSTNNELFSKNISIHCRATGKQRFINKNTANTQRIELLHYLYPDAFWIHLIRDGRAVANSLYRVKWWPSTRIWWLHKTPHEWNPDGSKWIQLCAMHWEKNVQEIRSQATTLHPRYLEVRYEKLVKHPKETIETIMRFTHLTPAKEYIRTVPSKLPNYDDMWQTELSASQKIILQRTINSTLNTLGYIRS